jgi:mannose-6-phosphate isomerase-like protein (cupin superfamily)
MEHRHPRALHLPLTEALMSSPPPGNLASEMAVLNYADIEFYQPRGTDPQKPHSRDELYIVASGSGVLRAGNEEFSFATGDVLFVAAYVEHRFTQFSNDFAAWVIFYGAERDRA